MCDTPEIAAAVDCCTRPRRFARRVGRSWGRISVAQARRDLSTRAPAASGGPLGGAAPCIEAQLCARSGGAPVTTSLKRKLTLPTAYRLSIDSCMGPHCVYMRTCGLSARSLPRLKFSALVSDE